MAGGTQGARDILGAPIHCSGDGGRANPGRYPTMRTRGLSPRPRRWTPSSLTGRLLGLLLLVTPGLTGCASQELYVQRVQAFAHAGASYGESLPAVLDASFESTVTLDSLLLGEARQSLDPEQRLETWVRHTELLEERRELLGDLKQHAALLRSYFLSLGALSGVEADASGLPELTSELVTQLGAVGVRLGTRELGGTTVAELVPEATALVLGKYQAGALRQELERHGAAIERELLLEQRLLRALEESLEAEHETRRTARLTELAERFVETPSLDVEAWSAERLAALRVPQDASAVGEAAEAAASLHRSFLLLASGSLGPSDLSALLADVNRVLTGLNATADPDR